MTVPRPGRHIPLLLALLVLLPASVASAQGTKPRWPQSSDDLWATVNGCDEIDRPDSIGIRASMPASGRPEVLWMRFRVQYRDETGRWRHVATGADSGWRRIGASTTRRVESGWWFSFEVDRSAPLLLRGRVQFAWKRGSKVVRLASRVTQAGPRPLASAGGRTVGLATCSL